MSDRIACCVPFCRRSIAKDRNGGHTDWICGVHWPGVSRKLKAEYNLAKRRARRIIRRKPIYREYWKLPPGSPGRCSAVAMWARLDSIWARCKRDAIERAAGI
ncbi:MAG: hypothetical protein EOQ34_30070 [Mesorhizobium sp.]|nr:hypothetical protein [Mesorhizobium sp.]RWF63913.1 MAG: hypothetical protein EOQ34_30070 [Mesorhizobium sp.]